jgi:hypothetical protein
LIARDEEKTNKIIEKMINKETKKNTLDRSDSDLK